MRHYGTLRWTNDYILLLAGKSMNAEFLLTVLVTAQNQHNDGEYIDAQSYQEGPPKPDLELDPLSKSAEFTASVV